MSSNKSEEVFEIFIDEINTDFMKMTGVSPVTDLALNMKSLTTSLSSTPSRRISWSNPFPSDNGSKAFLENLSPSNESPTLEEIAYRSKKKSKLRKISRKVLSLDNEDEKENILPTVNSTSDFNNYESDFPSNTQDSGYSDLSLKHFDMSPSCSSPSSRIKPSTFTDEFEEDGFECLFEMEEEEGEPNSMKVLSNIQDISSLLTKPLYPKENRIRQKLPIRRCLSMEMETVLQSPPIKLELISQTGTLIAAQIEDTTATTSPKRGTFKRPDPPETCFSLQNKRRKSSPSVHLERNIEQFKFQRSFSETATTIMHAVQKSDLEPDLIGDCTRCYALPLINGRHQDLKSISSQTLAGVLQGQFNHEIDNYTVVDCRYPYEFEGGHIQGALNIYSKEDIIKTFLEDPSSELSGKSVIIFHCEFSSERAPNLCRFLRNKDREKNETHYPKLHHPEIYILEGGYKAFFEDFKEYCEPQSYKPMNHKDHGFELKHFRAKSRSWGAESKSKYKLKTFSASQVL